MAENSETKRSGQSRRSFLHTLGVGAVSATVASKLPAQEPSGESRENGNEFTEGNALLEFVVNGKPRRLWIEPRATLAEVLRERLGLTGTKITCNRGMCGACTVLLDDRAIYSCHTLALDVAGRKITTIEGLLNGEKLHPLQQAFVDHDGLQCGFCTPGQIMAAASLLREHPSPTREQALTGMSGNLCRCAAYPKIIDSVLAGKA